MSPILALIALVSAAFPLDVRLANTSVQPGEYINAALTIDAKGRITVARKPIEGGVMFTDGTLLFHGVRDGTNVLVVRWPDGTRGTLSVQP